MIDLARRSGYLRWRLSNHGPHLPVDTLHGVRMRLERFRVHKLLLLGLRLI